MHILSTGEPESLKPVKRRRANNRMQNEVPDLSTVQTGTARRTRESKQNALLGSTTKSEYTKSEKSDDRNQEPEKMKSSQGIAPYHLCFHCSHLFLSQHLQATKPVSCRDPKEPGKLSPLYLTHPSGPVLRGTYDILVDVNIHLKMPIVIF